jgi:hypothetical protein
MQNCCYESAGPGMAEDSLSKGLVDLNRGTA